MSSVPPPVDPSAFRVEARAGAEDDWRLVGTHGQRQAALDAAAASIKEEPFIEARVTQHGRQVGHWQSHGVEALAPGVTVEHLAELLREQPGLADLSDES